MELKLNGKRGGVSLVSEEDYEKVKGYSWYCDNYGYARASVGGKMWSLHRFIMQPKENEIVDHINRDKLDNRRDNLRIFSEVHKNAGNRKVKDSKLSQYKGVF